MRLIMLIVVIGTLAASAAATTHDTNHPRSMPSQIAIDAMAEGEVRKVDPAAKKITIKHGELRHLDMPAMTMVFQVKDPAMLKQLKAGDKIRFRAEKVGGAFTVVELEGVQEAR